MCWVGGNWGGVGAGIVVNTNTTKLVTTTRDTGEGVGAVLVRGVPHYTSGIHVANGNEYGMAGTYFSVRSLVSGIPQGPHFLCSTFSTFVPCSAVTFFRSLNIPLGVRHNGHIFPRSSGTTSVTGTLVGGTRRTNIHFIRKGTGKFRFGGNGVNTIILRDNRGVGYSSMYIYANKGDCPTANSAKRNCTLTGDTKRGVVPIYTTLIPLYYGGSFISSLRKLDLGGVSVRLLGGNGGICSSFNRVLFARFKMDNPIILSTSDRVSSIGGGSCSLIVSLGPTLSRTALSSHVLHSFNRFVGGSFVGSLSGLLPGGLVPIVMGLDKVPTSGGMGRVAGRRELTLISLVGGFGISVSSLCSVSATIIAHNNISAGRVSPGAVHSGLIRGLCFTNRIVSISTCANNFGLRVTFSANFLYNGGV